MTLAELFDAAVALYGERWQRSLARALGHNERTVRWWLEADDGHRLPRDLATRLDAIMAGRIAEISKARAKLKIREVA